MPGSPLEEMVRYMQSNPAPKPAAAVAKEAGSPMMGAAKPPPVPGGVHPKINAKKVENYPWVTKPRLTTGHGGVRG